MRIVAHILMYRDLSVISGLEYTEPEIVRIALDVRTCRRQAEAFDVAFAEAIVFARPAESERPGVTVSTFPGKGQWVFVFSTEERFKRHFGEDKPWLRTTGRDLLTELRLGIGLLFDIGERHGLPLLPQQHTPARFAGAVLPVSQHAPLSENWR